MGRNRVDKSSIAQGFMAVNSDLQGFVLNLIPSRFKTEGLGILDRLKTVISSLMK
jgi:hypothetical protein